MSFTNPLYEGSGCVYAMPLPAKNEASSLAAGPGAEELNAWTRRIDAIWAFSKALADWYRHEPIGAHDRQITCYLSEVRSRAEMGRNLRDLDRGHHLPV